MVNPERVRSRLLHPKIGAVIGAVYPPVHICTLGPRPFTQTDRQLQDRCENTPAPILDNEWSAERSEDLYFVRKWGDQYFSVNDAGHVVVQPIRGSDLSIDLYEVVNQLKERGVSFPTLIRFQDLLKSRVEHLNEAFRAAVAESGYENEYQGVYPVKVNQLREVVEEILDSGKPYKYGLECGSKSELMATLPYLATHETLLICNGCKDQVMYRLMLAGQRLGQNVIPVIERADEVELLLQEVRDSRSTAVYGVRVRLTTRGAGLWSESGGENSKFGLSLTELIELLERQEREALPLRLQLLHFHLGSQIADLENVRGAVEEAARIYVWMRRRGHDIRYLDVGGGLGVSYEAGNPDALGMINYSLDDYALTIVRCIKRICDEEGTPHPIIVSESGRAVTAHHSVLIVEALSSRRKVVSSTLEEPGDASDILRKIFAMYRELSDMETDPAAATVDLLYGDAEVMRKEMVDLFRRGEIDVEQKAEFERVFWVVCMALDHKARTSGTRDRTQSLTDLERQLSDHYLCNFSVFRSMVDHWAIGQRFPIMPIHRLDEVPCRRGVLVDLTCDSDGKVVTFVSPVGDKRYLELHEIEPNTSYYLGLFLMGAYQDIMGDMHNLYGRVTEAHVYADPEEPGNFYLEELLPGATVEEQLALVQYYPNDLERRMSDLIQQSVKSGRLRPKEGVKLLNQYRGAFRNMTYLSTELDD